MLAHAHSGHAGGDGCELAAVFLGGAKIAEGYLLQAIFYYMTGDTFCDSLDCRLNNAHWQKDLLYSQLKIGKLCNKHQALLDN
ncbi:MAG: DUF6775 family putative metallopeptidase [Candidatus Nitrosopelagicus sp.]